MPTLTGEVTSRVNVILLLFFLLITLSLVWYNYSTKYSHVRNKHLMFTTPNWLGKMST